MVNLRRIEDIYPFAGFNYEVLGGDKKGVSSIRINDQYRLEFIVTEDSSQEPVVTLCTITDITNHYKAQGDDSFPNQTGDDIRVPGTPRRVAQGRAGSPQHDAKGTGPDTGFSYTALNEIINGKRSFPADLAVMLAELWGTKAYSGVNMQTDYTLQLTRTDSKLLDRLTAIRKYASML